MLRFERCSAHICRLLSLSGLLYSEFEPEISSPAGRIMEGKQRGLATLSFTYEEFLTTWSYADSSMIIY